MKKFHLYPTPLAQLTGQHEARQLIATLLRILGLHQLPLALEIVTESFEKAAQLPHFRLPSDPLPFLLSIAKQKTIDAVRLHNLVGRLSREVNFAVESGKTLEGIFQDIFDEKIQADNRLALLFACCHPDLPMRLRMALLLRTNFTFSEKDIYHFRHSADLELLNELEEAPALILQHGIQCRILPPGQVPAMLKSVQETLLELFMKGYDHSDRTIFSRRSFCDTAFQMAHLLQAHPASQSPDTCATMALLCLLAARFDTRRGRPPSFFFLDEKNRAKWNPQLIDQGVAFFEKAGEPSKPGEHYLLARVLMEHTLAPHPRFTNWERIVEHLQEMLKLHPTYHYHLYYAFALAKNGQPDLSIIYMYGVPGYADRLSEDWLTHALMGEFFRLAKNKKDSARHYHLAHLKAPSNLKRMIQRKMLSLTAAKSSSRKKPKW